MILKKVIAVLISVLIMALGLTSCSLKHESVEESNLRILEEKYGKEFKIKECFGPSDCIAYPVDDPDLIFYSGYTAAGGGYDLYKNEIIARKYKQVAEKKFNDLDFKYKYYVDVDANFFNEETQKVEIMEFNSVCNDLNFDNLPSKYTYNLKYTIFFSEEALEMTDIEIFNLVTQLFDINNTNEYGDIRLYFVTNEEYKMTLNHYSDYTEIEHWGVTDFYNKLQDDYWNNNDDSLFVREFPEGRANCILRRRFYYSDIEDYIKKITTFEEFEEKMQEVRNNGLYKQ